MIVRSDDLESFKRFIIIFSFTEWMTSAGSHKN